MPAASTWPNEVSQYLSALPAGVDSYPECTCKGSVWRSHAEPVEDLAALAAFAPDPIARLLESPPVDGAWLPEVHFNTLLLLLRAKRFSSDQAFLSRMYDFNRALLSGRLYRILFAVTSPQWVVNGAVGRWSTFHKGVGLEAGQVSTGVVKLSLSYPSRLVAPLVARAIGTAFECAIELAGGKDHRVQLDRHGDDGAQFTAAWS